MSETIESSDHDDRNTSTVIREFVRWQFPLAKQLAPRDSDPLLDSGIVDSLGILEIVNFLGDEFGVPVLDEDLTPVNFASVDALVGFVRSRREG